MVVIIYFFCFRWAAVRCRMRLQFLWLHTLVPVYDSYHLFFDSFGHQSDAGGGLGFCGYILWFMSMIVIIYFFGSGGQQSDAGGGLGFCGYRLWFISMIVIIYFFWFRWAAVRCRRWLRFLWLHTLVPVCESYHLFLLCFRWAAVRCRRWLRFLWLHTLVTVYDSYHLFLCFRWAAVRCRMWLRFL